MYQYIHKNFNSIKVQLRLVTTDTTHVNHGFQFHKGTIKTTFIVAANAAYEISIP